MSIFEYNGSAAVAMVGKDCVGIASDTKLGAQLSTIAKGFKRVFKVNNRTLLGLGGLGSDVLTVKQKLMTEVTLYKLSEDRDINPRVFSNLVSSFLYSRRFGPYFVNPIICGLEEDKVTGKLKPFLSGMDSIGADGEPGDFVAVGTAGDSLVGTAESFFKKDMNPDELFEVLSQTLLSAVDRDCLTGWGGEVHILTANEHIVREIKVRAD